MIPLMLFSSISWLYLEATLHSNKGFAVLRCFFGRPGSNSSHGAYVLRAYNMKPSDFGNKIHK